VAQERAEEEQRIRFGEKVVYECVKCSVLNEVDMS
jgi:hypothetical protein